MSDRIPLSRKAGLGLARLLRGLLGRRTLARARASVEVLKREYRAGKDDAPAPPKAVPHRVVRDEPEDRPTPT